jgi:hypothetical protein
MCLFIAQQSLCAKGDKSAKLLNEKRVATMDHYSPALQTFSGYVFPKKDLAKPQF